MSDEETEIMTDADFERALDALREEGSEEVGDLLKLMNENRIISWEEAEKIMGDSSNEPIKSSLPQQTRPTEPDNETDVDSCINKLMQNDPKLIEINLNNMKRTPIPQIKRIIQAISENTCLEKLSLANMGLYDMDVAPLIEAIENNETIRSINLETNYLSGDFFAKLFKAALKKQSIEEIKAVNQGVSFSTTSEREIIDAVFENRGLTKVSINLRLPEGRHKIEQATIRNQEIRRILRRQAAAEEKASAETSKKEEKLKEAKTIDKLAKTSDKPTKTSDKSADIPNKPSTSKVLVKAKTDLKTSEVKLNTKNLKPAVDKSVPNTAKVAPAPISKASIAKHAAEAAAKKAAVAEAKDTEASKLLLKTDVKKITTNTVITENVDKKPIEIQAKKLKTKAATDAVLKVEENLEETIKPKKVALKKKVSTTTGSSKASLTLTDEETITSKVVPKTAPKTRPKKIIRDSETPVVPASRTTSFDEPMAVYPRRKLPSTTSTGPK